jgi:hypothetical protein
MCDHRVKEYRPEVLHNIFNFYIDQRCHIDSWRLLDGIVDVEAA